MKNSLFDKFFIVFGILLLSNLSLVAADSLRIYVYGDSLENIGKDIIQTHDKGFLVVGSTYYNDDQKSDVYVLKLDSNLKKQWSYAYGKNNLDLATGVVQAKSKKYLISGYTNSFGKGGYDAYVLCLDSMGRFLWEKIYGGASWDFFHDIIVLKDENFLLAGETYSDAVGQSDIYYVKINPLGDTLWTRKYGTLAKETCHELIQTHDSAIYLTGEIDLQNSDSVNAFLLRLDKNENFSWFKTYGGEKQDIAYDLIEGLDQQHLFLAGSTNSTLPPANKNKPDINQYLAKIDLQGNLVNQQSYGNSNNPTDLPERDDLYYSLAQASNGDLAFVGLTNTYGFGEQDFSVTFTDPNLYWIGGPSKGTPLSDKLEKVIYAQGKYIFLGNSVGWGQGNLDVVVMALVNITDTATKYYFQRDTITIDVKEHEIRTSIQVYPNPATDKLFVKGIFDEIQLLNAQGLLILSESKNEFNTLNISQVKSGMYFLKIKTRGLWLTRKILINPE